MIAFGCATTNEEEYLAYARPSIARVAEPNALLMRRQGHDSIHEPYNEMLEEAAEYDNLEAVVLLHQDLSIEDKDFLAKIRGILAASPDVAVIGAAGARDVHSLSWWEGECHGGLEMPAVVPGGERVRYVRGAYEVDAVDGILLVLSPWAVRELRFDRELAGSLDGYDLDLCLQAREHRRRVVVGEFDVSHHVRYDGFFDRDRWTEAAAAVQEKWEF